MFIVNLLGKLWYGPETWNRIQEQQSAPRVRVKRNRQINLDHERHI